MLSAAVVMIAVAVISYVQQTVRGVQTGLPTAVLAQERDIVAVVDAMANLRLELRGARLAPSDATRQAVLKRLSEAERRLAAMRQTYNFDNVVGASAVHAIANPALTDVRLWLEQGVGTTVPPGSPLALRLADRRVADATTAAQSELAEAQIRAVDLLAQRDQDLGRFREALIIVVALVALLALFSIVLVVRQSADRRRAAAALAEQHAALDELLRTIPDGVQVLDRDLKMVAWNDRLFEVQEFDRQTVLSAADPARAMRFARARRGEFGDGDPRELVARHEESVRAPSVRQYERRLASGRWIEIRKIPMLNGGRAMITRDITNRKAMEAQLETARDAAEEANQLKSQFIATMNHELRTPLNAILGFSEFIAMSPEGRLSLATCREYAGDIHRSGQQLLALINDILDFSRVEARQLELKEEIVPLRAMVDDIMRLMRTLAAKKRVRLEFTVAPEIAAVRADERRLKQVLLNLLSNAVKFTLEDGCVELRAARADSGEIELKVRDTGIGIPKELVSRVTEPFFQVDGSLTRQQEGTGLGLAITRSLVELHGGRLEVMSEVGKGTEVRVLLPADRIVRATLRHASPAA
jgi:signal transduction histidine kinase